MMTPGRNKSLRCVRRPNRRRGAAAILAMMFLVIFSSLAAAMAIVAQGNLATADTQLKVSRALAAAETGMRFAMLRINKATAAVPAIREGQITATQAADLWTAIRTELVTEFLDDDDEQLDKADIVAGDGGELHLPPIALGRAAASARFIIRIDPHPISGVNYDDAMYDQAPYAELGVNISNTTRLDARWLRATVVGIDGPANHPIKRAVQMDFKIDKKIRFALLSKNRVMIGPHVLVDGPVASRFMDTDLAHGHPVRMASDFRGLTPELDEALFGENGLVDALTANDKDGDNRIRVADSREVEHIEDPESYDTNGDGYIDEFDYFLGAFDTNSDGRISAVELETEGDQRRAELFELLDGHGSVNRVGYNDGFIDTDDNYAKVHGQVMVVQTRDSWANGAAIVINPDGTIQDYFQGGIIPGHEQSPLTFQASGASVHQFEASDFNVDGYRAMAEEDLATQAAPQAAQHNPGDPESPSSLGEVVEHEAVPFGAAYPYDYYDRPVYRNMTFTNVRIPKGTNALFQNCTFIGVTFVETETDTTDPNYNYAGMQEADGAQKHPDKKVTIDEEEVTDTKTISNNLRFDNCVFEGSVVSDSAQQLAQVRNKISFTGRTQFVVDTSTHLTDEEKRIFRRSALLAANYSVELGTYIAPHDSQETVYLTGTIVAGVLDIRGRADIRGTVLTTFEPQEDVGPVLGETSPQFNTTLGYFSSADGDLEAEVPNNGLGLIRLTYDPNLPLPDGILGPVEMRGQTTTYREIPVPAGL